MGTTPTSDATGLQYVGLAGSAAVLGAALVVPSPAGVGNEVQLAVAVFVATVILWITKPVPYAVSSLLSVVLLYALGLTDTFGAAVSGFASTLVFFFVTLLLIGRSVAKVGLDDQVADRLVTTTSTPLASVRRLATALLVLAFLMPSGFARTVTFMPVVDRINDLYGLGDRSNFRRLGYYVIGHVNPLASLVVMTGGGMPITTSELINTTVRSFTWVEWVAYMSPPIVFLYATAVGAASLFYRVSGDEPTDRSGSSGEDGPSRTGDGTPTSDPLTRDQRIVVVTLLAVICLWVVGSFVGLPAIVPATFVVLVFSFPGIGIITGEEIRDISWGIVLLMGAMLSLLNVMQDLGAFALLSDVLFSRAPLFQVGLATMFVLFLFAVGVRSAFSSVSAALLLLLPILLEFATVLDVNRLYVSLSLPIVLGATVVLPFNVPTVLVAYERGPLTRSEVVRLGALTLAIGFLTVALCWFAYWPALEGVVDGLS